MFFDDDDDTFVPFDPARVKARRERERNRITIQLSSDEKTAVDWLSRLSAATEMPRPFAALRGKPARVIAKQLSGNQLEQLVRIRAARFQRPENN